MYIYLNTHIHKYTHKSMCVCVILIKSEWVYACVCGCVHYNYEHDISKAQKLRNEKVLRLSADSLYGQNHIAIFVYMVQQICSACAFNCHQSRKPSTVM